MKRNVCRLYGQKCGRHFALTTVIKKPHGGIFLGRLVFIPSVEFQTLTIRRGALKLVWRLVVVQHITKTLRCFLKTLKSVPNQDITPEITKLEQCNLAC